jgi:hydrogenase nickel incorporation protein HypB
VTEGEDKPLKYPDMFRAANLLLLNKCDLLPYLTFDTELAINYARRINPSLRVIRLSALRGEGMPEWIDWIKVGYRQVAASMKKIENSQHHVD